MPQHLFPLILWFLVCAPCAFAEGAPETHKQMEISFSRLGSEDFDVREKADSELRALLTQNPALATHFLELTLKADDAEILSRAHEILHDDEEIPFCVRVLLRAHDIFVNKLDPKAVGFHWNWRTNEEYFASNITEMLYDAKPWVHEFVFVLMKDILDRDLIPAPFFEKVKADHPGVDSPELEKLLKLHKAR